MNICIAGKNNIAINVCQYIIDKYSDANIYIIPNKNDKGINGFQRSFLKYAKDKALTICELNNVYQIEDLIFLSLEFDRIIKPYLFRSKKLFNVHFSLLPSYKGMYTSALPILFGEKYTGVTFHCIDNGIDTGDIIDQERIIIDNDETCKSLYFKYIKYGSDLVIRNIESIINDKYKSIIQPIENSTYYSKSFIDYSNININLNSTAYQIKQQIAAYNFRDYQLPTINGTKVVGCEFTQQKSNNKTGTILKETENYFLISTIDYDIRVFKDNFDRLLEICKNDKIDDFENFDFLDYYINEKETKNGWSPIIVAAYNNSKRILEQLLEKGADINDRNNNGTTVIMYAKDAALRFGDNRIIDLCLKHGANPLLKDFNEKNLYDYLYIESESLYNYIKNYSL